MPTTTFTGTRSSRKVIQQSERRENERAPLAAHVEILEKSSDASIKGRVSDLSLGGCYADTLNAFAEGTKVRVRIEHDLKSVELDGEVRFTQPGLGMGIRFQDVKPEQTKIMARWLALRDECASHSVVAERQEGAGLPIDILGALIELLAHRGVLTADERAELLGRL